MVKITTVLTTTGWPNASRADLNGARRPSLRSVARDWHKDTLPKHFAQGAGSRYHYARRSRDYYRQKLRRFGHNRPLVYTGESERAAKMASRITGSAKTARLVLPLIPRYFHAPAKGVCGKRSGPDKMTELGRITPAEGNAMVRLYAERLARRLDRIKTTKTLRS